jgi:ABC-type uncharacterized transport system substrate-binding protein
MGIIGVLMSMSQNDAAMAGRRAALLAALANEGITPDNTNIEFKFAFDNGGTLQYQTQADQLVQDANNAAPPRALFATCWQTMNAMLTSANNINNIPITYAGLFHDDQAVTAPNSFGQTVGGVYSHLFEPCTKWVQLIKGAVANLQAIGVTYDMTSPGVANKYINYIQAAAGITPTRINIDSSINSVAAVTTLINTNLLTGGNTIANSGLIVPPGGLIANRRNYIIQAANALRLKAIYTNRMYVDNPAPNNGLMSHGAVLLDQYLIAGLALANAYKNPASFNPGGTRNTNFETVVSRSRANALGVAIPPGAVVVL